ncbi:hypothetical protein K439DRAFT_1550196 [Ramaria rubella]|nr:hypothetical protein K439DRAFT_1550196 [Ramaria rubella]
MYGSGRAIGAVGGNGGHLEVNGGGATRMGMAVQMWWVAAGDGGGGMSVGVGVGGEEVAAVGWHVWWWWWWGLHGWAWRMGMAADEVGGGRDCGGGWRWGCECRCGGGWRQWGASADMVVHCGGNAVVGVLVVWQCRQWRRSVVVVGLCGPSPAIGGSAGHAGVLWLPVSISLVLMVRPKTCCGGLMRAHAGSQRHGGAYRTLTTSRELGSTWVKRKVARGAIVGNTWANLEQPVNSPCMPTGANVSHSKRSNIYWPNVL